MDLSNRVLKYNFHIMKKSIFKFLITLALVNIFFYLITIKYHSQYEYELIYDNKIGHIVILDLIIINIFMLASSFESYAQNFKLALNFGASRKEFYKSLLIINLISSFLLALVHSILQLIDIIMLEYIEMEPFIAFRLHDNPIINFIIIMISLLTSFLAIYGLYNIFAILQYRYNYGFWIVCGTLILFGSTIFGKRAAGLMLIMISIYNFLLPILNVYTIAVMAGIIAVPLYIIGYFLFKSSTC